MNITQLEFFEDVTTDDGKRGGLKPIDFTKPIGMYKELKDIRGVDDLTDKALELLHYLYKNHARPEDGFINAKKLAGALGYWDTREIRKLCTEIDIKTDVVIYPSQNGYKIASNDEEIDNAIWFALRPLLTVAKRVAAKSKNQSKAKMLQGFIGNLEKEFGGHVDGQQVLDVNGDGDLEQNEVNHFPKQPFVEYMPPIDERIKEHEDEQKKLQPIICKW